MLSYIGSTVRFHSLTLPVSSIFRAYITPFVSSATSIIGWVTTYHSPGSIANWNHAGWAPPHSALTASTTSICAPYRALRVGVVEMLVEHVSILRLLPARFRFCAWPGVPDRSLGHGPYLIEVHYRLGLLPKYLSDRPSSLSHRIYIPLSNPDHGEGAVDSITSLHPKPYSKIPPSVCSCTPSVPPSLRPFLRVPHVRALWLRAHGHIALLGVACIHARSFSAMISPWPPSRTSLLCPLHFARSEVTRN